MANNPTQLTPTPNPPEYFDYTRAAREAHLSAEQLTALIRMFEQDYPHDVLLRELHVLRACNAILRGAVGIQDVLSSHHERAA